MAMRIPLFLSQRALKIQYQTIQIFDFADPVVAGIRDRIRVRGRGQKLVLSKTVDQGLILLRKVLDTLTKAGFSINLKKCSFLATEIEYLGRTISADD